MTKRPANSRVIFKLPARPHNVSAIVAFTLLNFICGCCQGEHLNRGVTLPTDYTVTIGNEYCTPVGELSDNLLTCRAPAAEPNHVDVDSSFCDDNYAIVVSVS